MRINVKRFQYLSMLLVAIYFCSVLCGISVAQVKEKPNPTATAGSSKENVEETKLPQILVGDKEQGWVSLTETDFENVNCKEDTWAWREDGTLYCNGNCVGVLKTKKQFTNVEISLEWKHLQKAGNSGVFVWSPKKILDELKPNSLPHGIECQVLDHGYTEQYEKSSGQKATWFTTNGDVFPVGSSKMKPFAPLSPNGVRSFPSANHTNGFGEWNHYYIRAVNGEVRLWVNGHEVSGGNKCEPATGFIALEAEGAPIEFRNIKIRVLE